MSTHSGANGATSDEVEGEAGVDQQQQQQREQMSPLTHSDLHAVLSSERRAIIIDALAELAHEDEDKSGARGGDGWISRSELASVVAERTEISQRTAYGSLYHHHLPRLDEEGVIVRDSESNAVRRGPNFEAVRAARNAVIVSQGVDVNE